MTSTRYTRSSPNAELADVTSSINLTLVSAVDLPPISRRWSRQPIEVHAEVQLDDSTVEKSEAHDVAGGTNPTWNFNVSYKITSAHNTRGNLVVKLYYKRCFRRQTLIGEVRIGLKELLEAGIKSENAVAHHVNKTLDGKLNISHEFEVIAR